MSAVKPAISSDLLHEVVFMTSRSSGPGGQNVNKVNTKVTLKWDVLRSTVLNAEQREIIARKLAARITNEGILLITAQDKRSQLLNKEEAVRKLDQLLKSAFAVRKIRKATKPGKAAKQRRIQEKKIRSEKKQWRQKP
jgi:ribosome-associated protein